MALGYIKPQNNSHWLADRGKESPNRRTLIRIQGESSKKDEPAQDRKVIALAKMSHNYLKVNDLLYIRTNVSLIHALKCLLPQKKKKRKEWCLSFSFSPTECQIIIRAFCIGEYGTSIETQLYHHFKLNRYKIHLLLGNSHIVVRK